MVTSSQRRATNALVILIFAALIGIWITGSMTLAHADPAVWTYQSDYPPQSTVTIYGSGFLANSPITVAVTNPDGSTASCPATASLCASSDGSGAFTATYLLDDLTGTYMVTATDGAKTATTTFTDATGVDTTTSLTIDTPQNSGSTVPFSGQVLSVGYVAYTHDGDTVTLTQYSSSSTCSSGAHSDVGSALTSNGDGEYSGTFTAPTVVSSTTFYYLATFAGYNEGGSGYYWHPSSSSCLAVTVNPVYSVTFQQTGIPTSGVTWGVTVGVTDHTGTGASIVVSGLTGTVSYSYDTPVSGAAGTRYVCSSGCTGSVSAATTVTGTYTTQYLLTVATSGLSSSSYPTNVYLAGSSVGTAYDGASYTQWFDSGSSTGTIGVDGTVAGGTGTQFVFTQWDEDSSTANPRDSVTMNAAVTFTADYTTQYYVTFDVNPAGAGTTNPTTDWYDAGSAITTITATANPGYAFSDWSITCDSGSGCLPLGSSDTTNPNSVTSVNGPGTITADFESSFGQFTSGGLCPLQNDQFRLVYTPYSPGPFKMAASNPGQFSYNVVAFTGSATGTFSFTISVPYPFVTQGANPIHVYDGYTLSDDCFTPGTEITSTFTMTGTATTTPSGALGIALTDYLTSPSLGTTEVEITLSGPVPASGIVFVTVHLDYGFKGSNGWDGTPKTTGQYPATCSTSSSGTCAILPGYSFNTGGVVGKVQTYTFDLTVGSASGTPSVTSINAFKQDPGIAGLIVDSNGTPVTGVKVTVSGPGISATVYTDQDGWYQYVFKYTGKAATFTVTASYGSWSATQQVTLKANGYVVVNFQLA